MDEYLLSLLNTQVQVLLYLEKFLIMSDDIDSKNVIEMKLLENSFKHSNKIYPFYLIIISSTVNSKNHMRLYLN